MANLTNVRYKGMETIKVTAKWESLTTTEQETLRRGWRGACVVRRAFFGVPGGVIGSTPILDSIRKALGV